MTKFSIDHSVESHAKALRQTIIKPAGETGTWRDYVQVTETQTGRWMWATDGHRIHGMQVPDDTKLGAKGANHNWGIDAPSGILRNVAPDSVVPGSRVKELHAVIPPPMPRIAALCTLADRKQNVILCLDGTYHIQRLFSDAERKRLTKAKLMATVEGLITHGRLAIVADLPDVVIPKVNVELFREALVWSGAARVAFSDPMSPLVMCADDRFAVVMPVRQ